MYNYVLDVVYAYILCVCINIASVYLCVSICTYIVYTYVFGILHMYIIYISLWVGVWVCVCSSGNLSSCSVNMAPASLAASSYVYGFTVDGSYAWVSPWDKGLVRCAYSAGADPARASLLCSAAARHALPRSDSQRAERSYI